MGKINKNPRYNVISMRISEKERIHLETLVKKTNKSVSRIMREAMEYFAANYKDTKPKSKAA
jgi:predicted DNA-binding protein